MILPAILDPSTLEFPNPDDADDEGLLAVGGDLSANRLLKAYEQGIFPWFEKDYPPLWWSPNPRMILKPNDFIISHSLKKSLKKPHLLTIDKVFKEVITACSTCSDRTNRTWITSEMLDAYCQLHELGYAHSFEIWMNAELVGGLYGISLGHAFFGESMFHRTRDTSKIALYYLCEHLKKLNFDFIDCQLPTKHLETLGAKPINRRIFLRRLRETVKKPTILGSWSTFSL